MDRITNSADDLKTIRQIMEESSRFLSLSGLSGIFAGSYAIAGALIAWFFILDKGTVLFDENFLSRTDTGISAIRIKLIADALSVLALSIATSLYLSARKAKKAGKNFWTPASRRLLLNLMVPLVSGGVLIVILLFRNDIELIVPAMLIFYGLALVNAGKFTYGEVFYLGILEIITGLFAAVFSGLGLWFWISGFGILHIIYGIVMYRKYEV